ncbi:unnamed protein product [Rotaria sordida]|uniref:Uncharacterized protein n=1 Tax=Rotaria sordida TaxID=392033 RepID=A0A815BSP6_9BILA|nr:unnamed protein product [Rotaria sordida]CAF1170769.1 unnamed protein product [Rotaria sordida]CAF1273716.1 unnamed protein product [Rotaria sordida]CAF3644923.1 unnamed protein product [Rotaria sordida]CAF3652845.1 unnamed protein product [Rotaria sordida]
MEDVSEARGVVDFVNRSIHIHRIIPSAIQEEVFCFIDYDGYGDSFYYKSHYHEQNPTYIQDILILDTCYSDHFNRNNIDRDLGKENCGCCVFGGDLIFKFLQQICAAMFIGNHFKGLDYSVRGKENLVTKLKDILNKLELNKKTVADVYFMMINYNQSNKKHDSQLEFSDYCEK